MTTLDIPTATLADLGRLIAARTGDTNAAAIARSTAPQLRFDAIMADLARDPERRAAFTPDELAGLVARIEDPAKRRGAWAGASWPEGYARRLTAAEKAACPTVASVDVAIYRRGLWYYGDSNPTEEDPTGLSTAQFVQDEGGDYIPVPASGPPLQTAAELIEALHLDGFLTTQEEG